MSSNNIITGQYVRLQPAPASIIDRLLAFLIDFLILSVYFSTTGYVLFRYIVESNILPDNLIITISFCLYMPVIFYHPLCEWLNHGRSLGKMVMKCHVAMADGTTPGLGGYLMRWLLYPIDLLTGFALPSMLVTRNNQRLGDLCAGTMVVKTGKTDDARYYINDYFYVQNGYRPVMAEAANLTLRQVDVISHTLYDISPDIRPACLERLTSKLESVLGVAKPTDVSCEDYLYTALNDYYYYASNIEV